MSLFVLDLGRLRDAVEFGVANLRDASSVFGDQLRWRICPECLWLTLSYDPDLTCGRRGDEPVMYGGWTELWGRAGVCSDVQLQHVPETAADGLLAALRLGGVNAVVEMLAALRPEDVGLLSSVAKAQERRARSRVPSR